MLYLANWSFEAQNFPKTHNIYLENLSLRHVLFFLPSDLQLNWNRDVKTSQIKQCQINDNISPTKTMPPLILLLILSPDIFVCLEMIVLILIK